MLIKCPECQRDLSDCAKSCPYCGLPVGHYFLDKSTTAAVALTDNMTGAVKHSAPNLKKVFLLAGSFLGCFFIWFAGTAFMLIIVKTNRESVLVFRPLVSFVCLWASRIWIVTAARLWPVRGEATAKKWFKAGFWLMTLGELVILPDYVLFLICQVARLGGYVFALYGMNYKPESSVGQNDAVVIEKGVD